jgi:hypothetical protein
LVPIQLVAAAMNELFRRLGTGLPDGLLYFQTKKSEFGYFLEDLATEDFGLFYSHLVYFTDIWYIL